MRILQNMQLLKYVFLAWKNYYYSRKNDWKLIIRANIHYSYQLQNKFFKIWQLYLVEERKRKIQNKISQLYYEKKLKHIYFLRLRYNIKSGIHERKKEQILIEEFILCYCQLEILVCSYTCINLKLNLMAKQFNNWKWKNEYLKVYFGKLLNYTNHSIIKKNYKFRVNIFLRSKYNPEELRPYFESWIRYTNYTFAKKEKINKAEEYYLNNLVKKSFNQLLKYQKNKCIKRTKIYLAEDSYERKTKTRILINWRQYVQNKLSKNKKLNIATSYYKQKLIDKCFLTLFRYKNYKQSKKDLIDFIENNYLFKLQWKYFSYLKIYTNYRRWKLNQLKMANEHYNYYLKKYFFNKIKQYYNYRRIRKDRQNLVNKTLQERSNQRKIKFYFKHWKHLKGISQQKKQLESKSKAFYRIVLLKNIFFEWRDYTKSKIFLKKRNENIIKKLTIIKWRNFVRREIDYKCKLKVARNLYQKHLLTKGLVFLMMVGSEKRACKKRRALISFERTFQLQFKYYHIWKTKVFDLPRLKQCGRSNVEAYAQHSNNTTSLDIINDVFKWNDLCFQKPKIPENLYMF